MDRGSNESPPPGSYTSSPTCLKMLLHKSYTKCLGYSACA